jgi:apolipoprotein N-acyltransferase
VNRFFHTKAALWLALPVGAALSLAFAPFDWWWLALLCPAFLFLAWRGAAPRDAAKRGFLFTSGMYLAGTYWLYNSIHGIGEAPIWLTLFVMLAMVAILSAYTAFVGYALARWFPESVLPLAAKTGAAAGTVSSNAPLAIRYLLILPAAWVLLEWFRGWFLSGFPWLALGYSHLDTALAGLAPVGGVYALSLAVAMCAGAAALLVIGSTRTRMVAVFAILALWTIGFVLTKPVWTHPSGSPMTVTIVQGAVPQDEKWTTDPAATIRLYHELTAPHLGADVIVWPESALPVLAHQAMQILDPLVRTAHERGSRLVTGLVRYDFERDEYYNGLVAIDDEPQWYYKRRLVPFGEFFPVPSFVREWLKLMNLPYSDLTAGEADQPALKVKDQKIGATICYEDAYASDQLGVLKDATLLVNVTNDAWFGDSTAAHQHLQISRMRALEAGRPLLRAANDGVSAIIGANGAVVNTLPRFQPGVLTGVVQPRIGLTPYARVGNTPVILLCSLALIGVVGGRRVFAHRSLGSQHVASKASAEAQARSVLARPPRRRD